MEWTTLTTAQLRSVEFLRAPAHVRGHWIALIGLVAERECNGVILGAYEWTNRDWLLAIGGDRKAVDAVVSSGLATWLRDGSSIVGLQVLHYDIVRETKTKQRRATNTKCIESRWSGDTNRNTNRNTTGDTNRNTEERREEERREDPPKAPQGGEVVGIDSQRKKRRGKIEYPEKFNRFWDRTAKTGSKFKAYKAWLKLDEPEPEELNAGWERWERTDGWKRNYIPDVSTWLNGRCWEDTPPVGAKQIVPATKPVAPAPSYYAPLNPKRTKGPCRTHLAGNLDFAHHCTAEDCSEFGKPFPRYEDELLTETA